jgi:predicted dehydrogenase
MNRVRVLVVGQGHMGSLHARKLRERSDVDVDVLDPPLGLSPGPERPDLAIIACPTSHHLAEAQRLLDQGVHCLVEKPLAATVDEARLLSAYPHCAVGHIERFNPVLEAVAGVRPRFLEAERLSPWRAPKPGARGTDVDVIADLMVHDLDLVRLFLPGRVREVRASGVGVLSTGNADIVNARIEVEGPDGNIGVAVLTASRVSREPSRKLRLIEPGVYWSLDLQRRSALRVRWGDGELEGEPIHINAELGDPIQREHDHLLAWVRDGASNPLPATEGVAAMELADQVRDAARAGS